MKKVLKKISISLFIMLACILSGNVVSQAARFNGPSIGKGFTLNIDTLCRNDDIYCIDHGGPLKRSTYRTYYVRQYVKIEGYTATAYVGKKDPIKAEENAVLAYILGGGNYQKGYGYNEHYYAKTQRQKALWGYFNKWADKIGTKFGVGWSVDGNGNNQSWDITKEAKAYAKNSGQAQVKFAGSSKITTSNFEAQLPKLSYTGSITSIVVKDTEGKVIKDKLQFYVGDKQYKNVNEIPSNSKITIKNNSGRTLKKVTVNVKNDGTVNAEIWFLKASGWQNLIVVDTSKTPSTDTVDLEIETLGSIIINKSDSDTKEKLDGAKFKIKTSTGWLQLDKKTNKYIYNAKFENATNFETKDGTVTISNLKYRTYGVYEVKAPTDYKLSKQKNYDSTNKWIFWGNYAVNKNDKNIVKVNAKNKRYGKITITKADKLDANKKLKAGFKIYSVDNKKWVKTENGKFTYNSSEKNADVYYTDETTGTINLEKIDIGKYDIYETVAPEGYELQDQDGYKDGKVFVGTADLTANNDTVTFEHKNIDKNCGIITVYKVDEEDETKPLVAGFKIYSIDNKKWVKGKAGSYTYNNSEANADVYYTDANMGTLTLEKLKIGKYEVYETVAPEGYDLKAQNGYKDGKVLVGTADLTLSNNKVPFKHKNSKLISISGYVWVDIQGTKANVFNSIFDGENIENKVEGVTVNLVNKSTKEVKATTKTNASGEYRFEKQVSSAELANYYIEFNYNGVKVQNQDISKYIPVAFNSEKINEIVANGSRAVMNEVATKDVDLCGIATTYMGTEKEATYGLSSNSNIYNKLYNSSTRTLENINLGIKKLPETKYDIAKSLAQIKVVMKGFTYTYEYDGLENRNLIAAPKAGYQLQQIKSMYTRAFYPSDVAYDVKNSTEELKSYVIYRIDIKNTNNDMEHNMDELYQEKKLIVTNLVSKFDANRYELHDSNWTAGSIQKDNKGKSYQTATISKEYLDRVYGKGIAKGKFETSFIEYSIKHDALVNLLQHPNGIIEEFPTEVTSTAHHEYTRQDYSWKNDIRKEQTHTTSDDIRKSEAPYILLKLDNTRTISGTVFEDKVVTNNGEKLGNGMYDNKENVAEKVKVELLDVKENVSDISNLSVSHLYGLENNEISREAVTYTDKSGKYTFGIEEKDKQGNITKSIGVVPGEYYLRFTYGDGTQKLYDSEGNEVKTISAKEYKSTIVTSNAAKDALKNGSKVEATKHIWYKKLEGDNYSVAVDELSTRKAVNENKSNTILAGTARVSITVENSPEDKVNITVNENGEQVDNIVKSNYNGFNFGIIEQPKQEAKVNKVITNIKLIGDDQNRLVFDGNPTTATMKGVSDLDKTNKKGSTYVRAEVENETIYGSTLTITYAITVTNISDVNYYNEEYYKFGEANANKEVTLKVEEVTDYLDETLKYVSSDKEHTVNVPAETEPMKDEQGNILTDDNGKEINRYKITIKGWDTLYTEKNKNRKTVRKTLDTANITAQRTLSNQDDDMEVINDAELKADNVKNSTDSNDSDNDKLVQLISTAPVEVHTNGRVTARITITPPTGEDRNSIIVYALAGTVALAILSLGIVIIKKKVL